MDGAIISAALACAASIVAAIAGFLAQRSIKRKDAKDMALAEARKTEALLSLALQAAASDLSFAVACAVKRGKPNGEIEAAITTYEAAKKAYYAFLSEQAAERLV